MKMKMKSQCVSCSILLGALLGVTACNNGSQNAPMLPTFVTPQSQTRTLAATLQSVVAFKGMQVTGITVSQDGRKFACFPRWRKDVSVSVVEIKPDGSYAPYPDQAWNQWSGRPRKNAFTSIQSVVAHGNSLFILDPSNPEMNGVVGKPTLFEFDLSTNTLKRQWTFDENVAPLTSYLNDLRIDDQRGLIYITESGLGALIVLDMNSGKARRLLDQSPTTKSENQILSVNNKALLKANGLPQRFNVDGIALNNNYLYYHAVTALHLYRIPTSALADTKISQQDLVAQIEDLGQTPMPDGMIFDSRGNLYMGDLQHNAVVYRTPDGQINTLVQDPTLHWADTFAISADGRSLLLSDSHLDQAAPEQSAQGLTFNIYQVALP